MISSLAAGILGHQVVPAPGKDLLSNGNLYTPRQKIQKEKYGSNVKHDTIDLTHDAKGMAKQLKAPRRSTCYVASVCVHISGIYTLESCYKRSCLSSNWT